MDNYDLDNFAVSPGTSCHRGKEIKAFLWERHKISDMVREQSGSKSNWKFKKMVQEKAPSTKEDLLTTTWKVETTSLKNIALN